MHSADHDLFDPAPIPEILNVFLGLGDAARSGRIGDGKKDVNFQIIGECEGESTV